MTWPRVGFPACPDTLSSAAVKDNIKRKANFWHSQKKAQNMLPERKTRSHRNQSEYRVWENRRGVFSKDLGPRELGLWERGREVKRDGFQKCKTSFNMLEVTTAISKLH